MITVPVQLAERRYEVRLGQGHLAALGADLVNVLGRTPTRAFVVLDEGVPSVQADLLLDGLRIAGVEPSVSTVNPSEAVKSVETWARLLTDVAATGLERNEPVIALGGGIVGDLAGFVAASYRRGVPVIQCPSTLLAMVDASVGGKTGFNLAVPIEGGQRLLKNFVGAFHQPGLVLIDTNLLASLDDRDYACGLAECVKHSLIEGGLSGTDLLGWTETNQAALARRDPEIVLELIERSVRLKAAVVANDERETASSAVGGRALLNLGHTFGHAIETLPGLSPDPANPELAPLRHGEAVGLGLVAACATAGAMGLVPATLQERVERLLSGMALPTRVAGLPDNPTLVSAMQHDKKALGNVLRLVLPTAPGTCRVIDDPPETAVWAGLDAIRHESV